jgi:hypothetical protein
MTGRPGPCPGDAAVTGELTGPELCPITLLRPFPGEGETRANARMERIPQ